VPSETTTLPRLCLRSPDGLAFTKGESGWIAVTKEFTVLTVLSKTKTASSSPSSQPRLAPFFVHLERAELGVSLGHCSVQATALSDLEGLLDKITRYINKLVDLCIDYVVRVS
jgi:hypothetical protein